MVVHYYYMQNPIERNSYLANLTGVQEFMHNFYDTSKI